MDTRVLQTMLPYFTEDYGNPHPKTHIYGWSAATAVEKAREQVASLIGASPKEIIFTSGIYRVLVLIVGATECNNIAVKGVAQFYKSKKNHIITTQIVVSFCVFHFRNINVCWIVVVGFRNEVSKSPIFPFKRMDSFL